MICDTPARELARLKLTDPGVHEVVVKLRQQAIDGQPFEFEDLTVTKTAGDTLRPFVAHLL